MSVSDRNVQFVRAITLAMALGGGVFALAIPPLPNLGLRVILLVIALVNAGVVFLAFRKATPVSRLGAVALGVLCVIITQALCLLVASLALLVLSQGLLWLAIGPFWVFETMTTSLVGLLPELIAAVLAYAAHLAVYGHAKPGEHATSQPPPVSTAPPVVDRDHRFVREITLAAAVGGVLFALALPPLLYLGSHPSRVAIALVNAGLVFLVFRKAVPLSRPSAVTLAVVCVLVCRAVSLLITSHGDLGLIWLRFTVIGMLGLDGFLLAELIAAALAYGIHTAAYGPPEPRRR